MNNCYFVLSIGGFLNPNLCVFAMALRFLFLTLHFKTTLISFPFNFTRFSHNIEIYNVE